MSGRRGDRARVPTRQPFNAPMSVPAPAPSTSAQTVLDRPFLRRLSILSIVEGISTLVLFGVAMPLKYLADQPMAVTIVGSLHGVLFMALVAMFLVARWRVPISTGLTVAGIFGAVLPFGPFVVDHWLNRLLRCAGQRAIEPATRTPRRPAQDSAGRTAPGRPGLPAAADRRSGAARGPASADRPPAGSADR